MSGFKRDTVSSFFGLLDVIKSPNENKKENADRKVALLWVEKRKKWTDQSSNRQPEFQRQTSEHEVGVGKGQVSGPHDKRLAIEEL